MYNKDIESNRVANQTYNSNQKKAAQERLQKNAAWNKAHKKPND